MKNSLYIGKVFGIKVFIHWTFLLLIVWIVYSDRKSGLGLNDIAWSVGFILSVFLCITLHELGHALAARRFHIQTKNITLLPIGGVAQLESFPEKPSEELIVAIAGPAVNIVIAALLFPFIQFSGDLTELSTLKVIGPGNFLLALFSVNVWLPIFNLIPAFPMDGGRIFRALLAFQFDRVRATRIAAATGQILALGFIFFGFLYNPFMIFIGLFIFYAAQAEEGYATARSLLHGYTVKDVLMREIPAIDGNLSVKDATAVLLNTQNKNFVVTEGDKPIGTLTWNEIITALQNKGEKALIKDIRNKEIEYLPMDMPLEEAWNKLLQSKKSMMLVTLNEVMVGVVDKENLVEFIFIRKAQFKNG